MTADDVINEIKTLPPEELAEVVRFVIQLDAQQPAPPSPAIDTAAFERVADRVLNRHASLLKMLAS